MQVRPLALTAAALAVGTCLAMDPAGWSPFGPAKWAAVSVLTLLAIAIALFDDRWSVEPRTTALWAVLVSLMALAAIGGLDPLYAWTGTPERHLGVLGWALIGGAYVAGQQLRRDDGEALAAGIVTAAWITGGYALIEAVWGEPIALASDTERLGGPFGSPAMLGAACALLLPTVLGTALDGNLPRWLRRAAIGSAVACLAALVGSGARAAWLGLALAAAAWTSMAVVHRRRHPHPPPTALTIPVGGPRPPGVGRGTGGRRRVGPIVTVAAVGVVGVVGLTVGGRLGDVLDRSHGAASRVDEWRVAARVIGDHPVLGTGPEGYRLAVPGNVDAGYERAYGRAVIPDRAHSGALDVTATGGLAAGLVYAALLVLVGIALVRALGEGGRLRAGLAAGVLAYLAQQQLLFPLAELDPLAWLLAGAVVAWRPAPRRAPPRRTTDEGAPGGRRPRVSRNRGWRQVRRGGGVFVAGLAAVALVGGALGIVADRLDRRALTDIAHGRSTDAVQAASDAVRRRPDVLSARLVLARAHQATGTLSGVDAALAEVARALDLSPLDPLALQERGLLLNRRAAITGDGRDVDAALAEWRHLTDVDPVNARWQLELGRAAAAAGDVELARSAWTSAADLAPDDPTPATLLAALPPR